MAHEDSKIDNKIVCREIPNSKTIRHFIEKRVREWIRIHGFDETSAHYQVIMNREGKGHLFSCQIEVQAQQERWTGDWADSGLHQTLMKTLNHMIRGPVPATA